MLILDWQGSDLDGAEVLRRAREKLAPKAPVLFMTNSSGEDDIVAGFRAGADDYLVKPLRRSELALRAQALLRMAYPTQSGAEQLQFGNYIFETRAGRLLMDGELLDVTHKEFALALLFFRNLGRPLSRAYIHEAVWQRHGPALAHHGHPCLACAQQAAAETRTRLPAGAGLQLWLPAGKAGRPGAKRLTCSSNGHKAL